MAVDIPKAYMDLFERRAFASLATLMPDGSPHVTPVWVLYEAPYVLVNTARGRVKDRNVHEDPRVAMAIIDPDNPYRYLAIQGRVVKATEKGAVDVINQMNMKYQGDPTYPLPEGEVRVTYLIEPENVWGSG
ncbi:MAG: PPOX class F420-dependent oxidoreductase [Anaerolineae bacterium]